MKKRFEKQDEAKMARNLNITVAVIIILFVAVLGLAAFLTGMIIKNNKNENLLENSYEKSFFDMSDGMNDIETKLSKLVVSQSTTQRTLLANDIWRQTSMIESNLAQLPIDHYSVKNTSKFINQLGDYIYSLNRKLQNGGSYSEEDEKRLDTLYEQCSNLNLGIQNLSQKIISGYRIMNHLDTDKMRKGANLNTVGSEFETINKTAIDYPEMIYDGPFSDALDKPDYKAIKDFKEISSEQGADFIYKKFTDTSDVKYRGKAGGDLLTYEYNTTTKAGLSRYVQLTVKGGLPIMVSGVAQKNDAALSEDEAKYYAELWANKLIGTNMQGVWISVVGGAAYVNLAPVVNKITYYPDLIKVKISLADGELLGWEANTYLQNHIERTIAEPMITEEQAIQNLSKRLKPDSVRLALIPKEWGEEILAYEIYSVENEDMYIIYINAQTGDEENILKVINTADRGRMLI